MGKKGNWFSAIKRVFSPHSKDKLSNQEPERKSVKEKRKKGFGKLRHGDTNSFLPIFREPSSIEKILGEAERDHNLVFRPPSPLDRSSLSSVSPPMRLDSLQVPSLKPSSPSVVSASPELRPPSLQREDLQRLVSPRSLSPSSASVNARVTSQRIAPPVVSSPELTSPGVASIKPPSPRSTSPSVPSSQAVPLKPPPLRLDNPSSPSPKPPSPRANSPRFATPRPPSPKPPSPRAEPPRLDAPRPTTPKPPSPRAVSPRAVQRQNVVYRPEPTPLVQHASATKIQRAFRGYLARRSFRALKGLVRLQGVVRGYNVKRQTINALKYMQQLVRVQSQIQSRRIKMLETQAQVEKDEAKWASSEAGNDNWDDSVLTKEERDARTQRKIHAIIKRERSMAYAYSHKLWKNSPKSGLDIRTSGGWNWVDRQLPLGSPAPSYSQPLRDYRLTPTRLNPSRLSPSSSHYHFRLDNNFDTKSTHLSPSRPIRTGTSRYSRGKLRGQDSPFKDDDSLISCPPFPSYMAPTVSAKAKARPSSNPKERVMATPSVCSEKRRMSFPPTQQGDMFRWKKGSLLMGNSSSHRGLSSPGSVVLEKHKTVKSVGNLSIDSTVSTPATVGRKPFNRYV